MDKKQFTVKINHKKQSIDIYDGHGWIYDIDLEQCTTSAEVLDWIMQIYNKNWCTPDLISEVIDVLNKAIPGGIQGSICPLGVDRTEWDTKSPAKKAAAIEKELNDLHHLSTDAFERSFEAVMKTYGIKDPALRRELWIESKRIHELMHHKGTIVPFPKA